jgi:oligopeptide/dipeptide ABC transporter ATP-binding protein
MPEPLLEVDGLEVVYHQRHGLLPALHDLSFAVRAGEILGVAGVSGNGQTELAEVLSGLREPTGGRVRVEGEPGRIPEDRRASVVGELSLAYNLVLEDLDRFRRGPMLDERGIRRRAEELIERFDIRARAGDPVAGLSGGNMQKVLLARALARERKALVVSQPTQGLDVGATEYVRSQLLAQRGAGAGIVLISEDLEELLALSDRLVVMYAGQVIEAGPTRDIFDRPSHPYTRGLLDAFPSIRGPRRELAGIPGSPPDLARPPSGCRFHPRCPEVMPACLSQEPELYRIRGADVRCLLYAEEAKQAP